MKEQNQQNFGSDQVNNQQQALSESIKITKFKQNEFQILPQEEIKNKESNELGGESSKTKKQKLVKLEKPKESEDAKYMHAQVGDIIADQKENQNEQQNGQQNGQQIEIIEEEMKNKDDDSNVNDTLMTFKKHGQKKNVIESVILNDEKSKQIMMQGPGSSEKTKKRGLKAEGNLLYNDQVIVADQEENQNEQQNGQQIEIIEKEMKNKDDGDNVKDTLIKFKKHINQVQLGDIVADQKKENQNKQQEEEMKNKDDLEFDQNQKIQLSSVFKDRLDSNQKDQNFLVSNQKSRISSRKHQADEKCQSPNSGCFRFFQCFFSEKKSIQPISNLSTSAGISNSTGISNKYSNKHSRIF